MSAINFTDTDRNSGTWTAVKEYAQVRITELQRDLEADRPPEQTAKLRGRIAEIRSFLRAGEPAREVVAGDD